MWRQPIGMIYVELLTYDNYMIYIQKYISYVWKRKVCYFGAWFMCCVSRRPWEQPGQASCLGYRYLDIWPLERTCVYDDDDDDDDDHDDDDDDGDDGEDNNDDGSSVCKALSQQEPQVNEALLCRVCSAKCKVQSGKCKVQSWCRTASLFHHCNECDDNVQDDY